MSSTFSFDNWDMLLDPAASSSGFSSPPTETPSSATSGEFQPFVNVGLSLSGGGIARLSLCCMEVMRDVCAVVSLAR